KAQGERPPRQAGPAAQGRYNGAVHAMPSDHGPGESGKSLPISSVAAKMIFGREVTKSPKGWAVPATGSRQATWRTCANVPGRAAPGTAARPRPPFPAARPRAIRNALKRPATGTLPVPPETEIGRRLMRYFGLALTGLLLA